MGLVKMTPHQRMLLAFRRKLDLSLPEEEADLPRSQPVRKYECHFGPNVNYMVILPLPLIVTNSL
jgi:hypothetical protein